ncbi:hypothetical protein [Haloterrigena salifodinae]|uniref:hypothetical protein n=1 Tax=Haloterrigena salifodinae TaxID=2675099 RepID=UPI000F88B507|nr:hypothetical protein [Haloterrigena salifodinae]
MSKRLIEIAVSSAVIFLAGVILWPPSETSWQWWTVLSAGPEMGLLILVVVIGVSTATGLGLSTVGGVRPSNLLTGGILAFIIGMALISVSISPDSPSHFLLYGFILVLVFLGAAIGYAISSTGDSQSNNRTESV